MVSVAHLSMVPLNRLGDARGGDEVVLAAEGDGADQALDELAALVARDLDSEE